MGRSLAEGRDQGGHVIAQSLEPIVGDAGRPGGAAVAAQVGRHGPVAGCRQRRHEVAVLVRGLRKAVEQEDEWPAALDLAVEPDPVRLDELGSHDRPMVGPMIASISAILSDRITLFDGTIDRQRLWVWVETWGADIIRVCTHEIGPALETSFGKDEIETYLTVGADDLGRLVQLLVMEAETNIGVFASNVDAAIVLLGARYAGEPAATSQLRLWLEERGIPYEFAVV